MGRAFQPAPVRAAEARDRLEMVATREDDGLLKHFDPPPIDRHWNWNEMGIEHEGRTLAAEKVAIVTGDQAVQGAMMISADPVPSMLAPGAGALFIELLFTAPRNRPPLRRDVHANGTAGAGSAAIIKRFRIIGVPT